MRIGVVSDTHLYYRTKSLPSALVQGLQGVDLILHAGDWIDADIVGLFEQIAPTDGVAGNNDGGDIINRFGRKKLLQLAGFRIGLVHGDGGRSTPETAYRAFAGQEDESEADVVIFGHSHIPYLERRGGVLMFNPGSPTDKRRQLQYSYGILRLDGQAEAEHFYYADKSP